MRRNIREVGARILLSVVVSGKWETRSGKEARLGQRCLGCGTPEEGSEWAAEAERSWLTSLSHVKFEPLP